MQNDFFYAILIGWFILFFFWLFILVFIYFRQTKESNLSKKLIYKSLGFFLLILVFLLLFKVSIRFY